MNDDIIILYVEDDMNIREEMLEIFELDFENIHVATNGKEGLQMFKRFHPDIIISDIQMPVMDGISMSKEILSIDPDAKIVLTTAFNEQSYLEEAEKIGIKTYISKPIDISILFEKINTLITTSQE